MGLLNYWLEGVWGFWTIQTPSEERTLEATAPGSQSFGPPKEMVSLELMNFWLKGFWVLG